MDDENLPKRIFIRPEMTVLEVVELYPPTETIFRKYDRQAGVCLCCQALFEPLGEMAKKYNLDLKRLLDDLDESLENKLEKP